MNQDLILMMAWVALVTIVFSRFMKNKKIQRAHITYLSANEFNELKNKNQLIDVRGKEEYIQKHIIGARNIPVNQLKQGAESKIFKNKPVYLYCQSGKRATKAAKLLLKQEYSNIVVMKDSLDKFPGKFQ